MWALSTLAFVLIVLAAMINLIIRDWRITAGALAVQYLAAFVLVTLSWPIGMAVVKLIAGWMSTAAIAFSWHSSSDRRGQRNSPPISESTASLFFRGVAGLLIVLLIFILSPVLQAGVFPQVDLMIVQGGLMLMSMSLMQLGTNSDPYLMIISLLSFLMGFEVIHAALELSTLLTGLFVIVNLGLALVGVYFMVAKSDVEGLSDS
jgi:hypothetical protein